MAKRAPMHFEMKPGSPAVPMEFPSDEPEALAKAPAAVMIVNAPLEALDVPKQAMALVVSDQETLDAAKEMLLAIDGLKARVDQTFDPHIAAAFKQHKSLLAEKKRFSDPLDQAKQIVGRKAADYVAEKERIRQEAERKRLEADEKARKEAEKAVDKAGELQAAGKDGAAAAVVNIAHSKVEQILSEAPEVPEGPDTSGLTVREDWKFSIVDPNLLPREYLMPDEKKIGRIVRALKDQTIIPGVRVYAEKGVATRAPRTEGFEARA